MSGAPLPCQWVRGVSAWLPHGAWDECKDTARRVQPGERVVLGFDGSASGDSTALVGATVGPRPHIFTIEEWANPGDTQWRVPRADVDAAVDLAFERYDVVEMACDPWGWRSEVEAWAKRHGEKRVIEYNTGFIKRMAPASDRFYAAVMDQTISHDGDSRLAAHLAHCVATSTAQGSVIQKDKKNSPRKIDLAIAAIVALDRAQHHANNKRRHRAASF